MNRRRDNVLLSIGLLIVLLVVVALALSLLGSTVLLPQGRVGLIVAGLAVLFLVVQVGIFRWLGLRSRADDEPLATDDAPQDDDPDWRAWRG